MVFSKHRASVICDSSSRTLMHLAKGVPLEGEEGHPIHEIFRIQYCQDLVPVGVDLGSLTWVTDWRMVLLTELGRSTGRKEG